jgi:hypothetical protein
VKDEERSERRQTDWEIWLSTSKDEEERMMQNMKEKRGAERAPNRGTEARDPSVCDTCRCDSLDWA